MKNDLDKRLEQERKLREKIPKENLQQLSDDIENLSDKKLKEIAEKWCNLVGEYPTNTTLNAFMMGAKIAIIANNGWFKPKQR
jgi:hypothetical protein